MRALPLAMLALLLGAAPPGATVVAAITGLRSTKGLVQVCLTRLPSAFPDCRSDPAAFRRKVPAAEADTVAFTGVAPGRYALALLHDENGNGRADMMLMLPREGFGFSRNPALRFGPPRFARAAFAVAGGEVQQAIHVRYLL